MTAISSPAAVSPAPIPVYSTSIAPTGHTRCGRLAWRITDHGPVIAHQYDATTISDAALVHDVGELVRLGVVCGQEGFEQVATDVIVTSGATPKAGWAAFYDNSIDELRTGASPFAPIHRRARALVRGSLVLEVGSCFGLLALQLADDGHQVAACDISPGAVGLLRDAADRRGTPVDAVVGDATDLPYTDRSVDTVTLVHLLEHLSAPDAMRAIDEAVRVARRRVIVAVPFEEEPTAHFGHRVSLTMTDLRRWAVQAGEPDAPVISDHGGWLVLTPAAAQIRPRLLAM